MDYRMFGRKYLLGCLRKLGEVSKQQQVIEYNQIIHIVFCSFLFLSTRVLLSLAQAMLKSMPAHIGHCGPKPG